jgi:hypothetical protein
MAKGENQIASASSGPSINPVFCFREYPDIHDDVWAGLSVISTTPPGAQASGAHNDAGQSLAY